MKKCSAHSEGSIYCVRCSNIAAYGINDHRVCYTCFVPIDTLFLVRTKVYFVSAGSVKFFADINEMILKRTRHHGMGLFPWYELLGFC